MAFAKDRWIAQAAWLILKHYSDELPTPPLPAMTPQEYEAAYAYMDRVLACVNACAGVDIAELKAMGVGGVKRMMEPPVTPLPEPSP